MRFRWKTVTRAAVHAPALAVVALLVLALAPATVPVAAAQTPQQVRLDVSNVTPSMVRAGSPDVLTVSGTLTNTSGGTISNLDMRIQRGAPRATEASVTEALRGNATTASETPFTPVVRTLRPGRTKPFTLRVPLTGGADSLQLVRKGVYPLLLNVNGDLATGSRARVAESRFLLPVLTPPGGEKAAPKDPRRITTLIPLVDYPRMAREGFAGAPTVLVDDRLARSLAPGGRLFGLVQAVSKEIPQGSPLGNGVCFAIDPDLISTAKSMAGGYRVRQDDGTTRKGTGAGAARLWLSKVREIVQGRCVISLPYADADLVAMGRAGLPDLIKGALDGAGIIRRTFGVTPRTDVLWPINGALDEPAASQLANTRVRTVLMHPNSLALPADSLDPVRVETRQEGYSPIARPIDPLLSDALDPLRGSEGGPATALSPPGDATPSVQDTLGALVFRATQGQQPDTTSILAPPRRWNMDKSDLRSLLSGIEALAKAGYVTPSGLPPSDGSTPGGGASPGASPSGQTEPGQPEAEPSRPEQGPPGGSQSDGSQPGDSQSRDDELPHVALTYPVTAATGEIPQGVLDELAAQNYKVGELFRAAERDPALDVLPSDVTTPLRNGLLRGASSAWRGNPGAARYWVGTATETIEDVLNRVQINEFDGQITLTSSNSPIPVTVTNRLPVTMAVNLHVDAPPGIKVDDLGLLKIPPGSRQFWLETQVDRAGRFSVDITIRTEGGTQLGATRRLQLESNAYGTMPLIITLSGAGLLILLSARRIVRRARAARANAATTSAGNARGTDRPDEPGAGEVTAPGQSTTDSDRPGL